MAGLRCNGRAGSRVFDVFNEVGFLIAIGVF